MTRAALFAAFVAGCCCPAPAPQVCPVVAPVAEQPFTRACYMHLTHPSDGVCRDIHGDPMPQWFGYGDGAAPHYDIVPLDLHGNPIKPAVTWGHSDMCIVHDDGTCTPLPDVSQYILTPSITP